MSRARTDRASLVHSGWIGRTPCIYPAESALLNPITARIARISVRRGDAAPPCKYNEVEAPTDALARDVRAATPRHERSPRPPHVGAQGLWPSPSWYHQTSRVLCHGCAVRAKGDPRNPSADARRRARAGQDRTAGSGRKEQRGEGVLEPRRPPVFRASRSIGGDDGSEPGDEISHVTGVADVVANRHGRSAKLRAALVRWVRPGLDPGGALELFGSGVAAWS